MDGLIDVEAERTKLKKLLEKCEVEIKRIEDRLNNPNFSQKAPAAVLEENRKRLTEWQQKQKQSQDALAALGA